MVGHRDSSRMREEAITQHERAMTLTRIVLDLVHGRDTTDDETALAELDERLGRARASET